MKGADRMKINRAVLKQSAKKMIRETNPSPVIVGLIYVLILYVVGYLYSQLVGYNEMVNDMMTSYMKGNWSYLPPTPDIAWYSGVIAFALSLMSFILQIGFYIYCLNVVKKQNPSYGNLFDGFGMFFKYIWLGILSYIFVFLWTLLFIIPGIVAAYRYRQAFFIMIENPEMSALEGISASKKMMDGHKWELFVMDLSFLGWYILCAVPFVSIWVMPYATVSYATYYIALREMPQNPQFAE